MKVVNRVVIHSCRENDERAAALDWCEQAFGDKNVGWSSRSNYREEGTFDLIFTNQNYADLYMMRWGGKILDIEYIEDGRQQVDPDVFARLFEIEQ